MNFLNVFEQRIGGLFGATSQGLVAPFSFKKLAKKAAREMEAETFVINGVDTAPALYTILVSSEDDMLMRPLYQQLCNETAQFIEGQAQGKGYVFVGRPVVRFMADPSLKSGRFSVFAENVDAQTLNRLREEEARFLGADSSLDGGLGGAASQGSSRMRPVPQPSVIQPQAQVPAGPLSVSSQPLGGMEAGLDVLPQEAVFDAEEAARGAAARRYENVPLVGSQPAQAGYAAPAQPAAPGYAAPSQPAGFEPPFSAARAPEPAAAAPRAGTAAVPSAAVPVAAGAASAAGAAPHRAPRFSVPEVSPEPVAAPQPRQETEASEPRTVRTAQPVSAPPARKATCLLIDRQSGRTYTGTEPRTTVGRERTPGGIVLHDPNVSRSHAELSYDGQSWHIRDLNSTNGTLVNDVDVDECILRDGDLITLGLTNLEFREN
ncbi:FhaA domain-containing protein [uncultured Parolsenella sp.]|uniref:FhaA domain-containing protein n=1 Tax=uncultured Parolsenella sp. TaxID=2083008 RepID=UPI0027D96DB9|nr:FhaA domain-containing protein [uncultured Parolsenella sp.]